MVYAERADSTTLWSLSCLMNVHFVVLELCEVFELTVSKKRREATYSVHARALCGWILSPLHGQRLIKRNA